MTSVEKYINEKWPVEEKPKVNPNKPGQRKRGIVPRETKHNS